VTEDKVRCLNASDVEREELPVDVVLVGAGPASLACAIHLRRLLAERGLEEKTVLVIDKAEEIGHHTLSGSVMDPRGMAGLFPDWRERGCPIEAEVGEDLVVALHRNGGSWKIPGLLTPPQLRNHGNVIIILNRVVRWMAEQAEELGCEVYAGFPAAEVTYEGERVTGVVTRDSGIGKNGEKKSNFEPGMRITAAVTVFAEGSRGNLTKGLIKRLGLDAGTNPQTWATGIKEVWEVSEKTGSEMFGKVMVTGGHPLGTDAYGGGFIYGLTKNRLALGFVVGLDYHDARLDPHALFVRWKQHPRIAQLLEGGKILRFGAKTIPEGGVFAIPRLFGDGFCLVGDAAGMVNAATLKGVHLSIESGRLAAEAIADALQGNDTSAQGLGRYGELFEASWAHRELWGVRNYRQAFDGGLFAGMVDFAAQRVSGGRGFFKRRAGHTAHSTMRPASESKMSVPKFDDTLALDKLTDVYHSGAVHEEDQPSHLVIPDPSICVDRCTEEFGNPCQHFCPAAVYEWPANELVLNPSNCVHCKTCDIADPYENIEWVVPEGGGGPNYTDM
jgi:electron-transferring-flavoprotein dehydrogenase